MTVLVSIVFFFSFNGSSSLFVFFFHVFSKLFSCAFAVPEAYVIVGVMTMLNKRSLCVVGGTISMLTPVSTW